MRRPLSSKPTIVIYYHSAYKQLIVILSSNQGEKAECSKSVTDMSIMAISAQWFYKNY